MNYENSKEKNKNIVIIVLICLVLVLGVVLFVVINGKSMKETEKNNENKQQENGNNEEKNQDDEASNSIKDENIKQKLNDKMDVLKYMGITNYMNQTTFFSGKTTFTTKEQVSAILYYYNDIEREKNSEENIDWDKYLEKDPSIKDNIDLDGFAVQFAYTGNRLNEIKKLYKEVFGTEVTTYENDIVCPRFHYSEKLDMIYGSDSCGGVGGAKEYTYNYSYTEDADHYYVSVSYAVGLSSLEQGIYTISDYNDQKTYKEFKYIDGVGWLDSDNNDSSDFEINKDNYKDFSHYVVTFDKNYVFQKIEQLD